MRKTLVSLLLLVYYNLTFAQLKFTVSGIIKDVSNGETMVGVTIYTSELKGVGAVCNEYGFYSLSLPQGSYHLIYSFLGYNSDTLSINLNSDLKIDCKLKPSAKALNEVIITSEKGNTNLTNTEMGVEHVKMKEISKLPVIFGEKDVVKSIQLLPGVKPAGEGQSGFFVRGGSADQNLILLDEAPVYNASHLLGFFSTFNSDAIKDATLIKGNSTANYGGRLSSVLDVKMKEGNNQDFNVNGGIGLISSRLSVEGPIVKDKSSFIISGRRTYIDVPLKLSKAFKDNSLYFYDLNTKANYILNDKNKIYISGYFGRDVLALGRTFGLDWGNKTATMRWNSIINPKLFSNTSIIYSDFSYNINTITIDSSDLKINSKIQDWNLKQEFSYFMNDKNTIKFGFNSIYHTFGSSKILPETQSNSINKKKYALENSCFITNTHLVSKKITIDYGFRFSNYSILGRDTLNVYSKGVITDTITLASGEFGKTYNNIEPRIQLNFMINEKSSIKGGYSRNTQHLHLLSNVTSGTPTDRWLGDSYNIKPQIADQFSLGYYRNIKDNNYKFSVETYYKALTNELDYKDGADIENAVDIESEILFGIGRAYGLEFLVKKTKGKFTGWLGYTLSKTERKIVGINNDDWYNSRQDRTHDITAVAMYQISKRWDISSVFTYQTGNAVTFPSGKYNIDGNTVYYYTERNGYRMPAYHRLDFSATYTKPHKKYESSWNFSLYNVYGNENPYTINFRSSESDPNRIVAVQTTLFRWVPSITYNFKF